MLRKRDDRRNRLKLDDVSVSNDDVALSFVSGLRPRGNLIHEVTDDHIIMTWDRCLGLVWKKETTVAGMESYVEVYRELVRRYPTGIYLLTIVEQAAPMPSHDAREAVAVFMRTGSNNIRMSAVVHEGGGFRAAAVRSVVTGFSMLTHVPYPHRIFPTVEQGIKWLATTKHGDVDELASLAAVRDARHRAADLRFMLADGH